MVCLMWACGKKCLHCYPPPPPPSPLLGCCHFKGWGEVVSLMPIHNYHNTAVGYLTAWNKHIQRSVPGTEKMNTVKVGARGHVSVITTSWKQLCRSYGNVEDSQTSVPIRWGSRYSITFLNNPTSFILVSVECRNITHLLVKCVAKKVT